MQGKVEAAKSPIVVAQKQNFTPQSMMVGSKPKLIRQEVPETNIEPVVVATGVSAYTAPDSRIKIIITLLVVLLVLLAGILGLIFLFRQQLIQFFNSLFQNA